MSTLLRQLSTEMERRFLSVMPIGPSPSSEHAAGLRLWFNISSANLISGS